MRRTYKSKKDTVGSLDPRDLLLGADEKSSVFDAFYIQNIKQTKRELSAMGTSNQHRAASNKVRKRKYIKRIIRELREDDSLTRNSLQESISGSVFLTPDKSIRLNKAPDPFDQLLNSSPVSFEPKREKKDDLFDQIRVNKPVKNYTRKKKTYRRLNCSSDSTESDKENTSRGCNDTQNTTDIRAHEFVIEKETKPTPKIDESINRIVKNLSLINNLHQQSLNAIQKHKYNHRLTKNFHTSPINSPLSSTPFANKHRSKSIYKFSPIRIADLEESSNNFVTIIEEQNQSPNINTSKNSQKSPKICTSKNSQKNTTPTIHFETSLPKSNTGSNSLFSSSDKELHALETQESMENHSKSMAEVDEIVSNDEQKDTSNFIPAPIEEHLSPIPHELKDNFEIHKTSSMIYQEKSSAENEVKSSIEISSIETSEAEPFLGFSKSKTDDKDIVKDYVSRNQLEPLLGFSGNPDNEIEENESDNDEKEISIVFSVKRSNSTKKDESRNRDSKINKSGSKVESFLSNTECTVPSQPFLGFEIDTMVEPNKMKYNDFDNISNGSIDTEEENAQMVSQYSDTESLYDTCCNSDESSSKGLEKEPIVVLDKLSDSVFQKFFSRMQYSVSESTQDDSFEVTLKKVEIDDDSETSHYEEYSDKYKNSFTGDSDNLSNDEEDSDNYEEADDTYSSKDDSVNRTISFVTTRRRNEAINNATILVLDDSCPSPSCSDTDKTVLSNNIHIYANLDIKDTLISSNDIPRNNGTNTELSSTVLNTSRENIAVNKYSDKILNISSIERKTLIPVTEKSDECNLLDDDSINACDVGENDKFEDRVRNSNENKCVHSRISNITTRKSTKLFRNSVINIDKTTIDPDKPAIILQPGKKWERSLSIYKRMTMMADHFDRSILEEEDMHTKGRKYRQSVINTMEMQECIGLLNNDTLGSRRNTLVCKPSRTTIRIVKESSNTRVSLSNTSIFEDLHGFIEDCDDTVVELSKLSIAEADHEVTILEKFHETNHRITSAKEYVLRRCNQTDPILFDECYPDTLLKNCRKIGEGVYGEVYLWRAPDGRARVMKIVPIAGNTVVNGERQKDFHEIIAEIVIAMELSALRAPIAEIECNLEEGKDIDAIDLHSVENATDVFNEVLTVRCVYGTYPSRLLDLWELYDETRGSENDTPAALPPEQQFIVLELANAGQDLESFQFSSADQAYALFLQVAFGLAVGEEAYQFEHRDLHWGNVLIAPTDQKYATFVIRGRLHRVLRCGVAGTIIDYSLSRVALRGARGREAAALYNDLAADESLFTAIGDRQFEVYRLMRDKLGNDWKNFEPYTNILWLHYIVDKMITAVRYKRTNTKIHKQYISKLKSLEERILAYGSAVQFVLTDNEY